MKRDRILREGPCPRTGVLIVGQENAAELQLLENSRQRVGGRGHAKSTKQEPGAAPGTSDRRFPKQFGTVAIRARSRDPMNRSIRLPGGAFRLTPERSGGGGVPKLSSPFLPVSQPGLKRHSGTLERSEAHRGRGPRMPRQTGLASRICLARAKADARTRAGAFQYDSPSDFGKPNGTPTRARRPPPGRSVPSWRCKPAREAGWNSLYGHASARRGRSFQTVSHQASGNTQVPHPAHTRRLDRSRALRESDACHSSVSARYRARHRGQPVEVESCHDSRAHSLLRGELAEFDARERSGHD